jgi:endonuclease YncB( thermonuclease family)
VQQREQERVARKKERGIWRRERREQMDEEFRLREQ